MLKLAQLVNDPSRLSQISNRHIVALCNLSTRIDTARSKSTQKGQYTVVSFRLDVTDDPDAVLECTSAGLDRTRELGPNELRGAVRASSMLFSDRRVRRALQNRRATLSA